VEFLVSYKKKYYKKKLKSKKVKKKRVIFPVKKLKVFFKKCK